MNTQAAIHTESKTNGKASHPAFANHPQSKLLNEALKVFEDDAIIHFPEKYFAAQTIFIRMDVKELHQIKPKMSVRAAVVHIMKDLPDFLPPENLIDVSRLIIEEWVKLSQPQLAEAAQAA